MKLRELLDLLDPMTPLRIICYEVVSYYATPIQFWQSPDFHPDDLDRKVAGINPGIRDRKPLLMLGLATEAYLREQERLNKMFRPVKETD